MRQLTFAPNFPDWQRLARRALTNGWPPPEIAWEELGADQPGLAMFGEGDDQITGQPSRFRVPRQFVEIATRVACHRAPHRWALLYRVLWRLTHGEPRLLEISVDDDVHALQRMDKAIRHEVHKMRAFVRFRSVPHAGTTWYVAWFEPEHHTVMLNAPFFRDRFAAMPWSILTPDICLHWDGAQLSLTTGVPKSEAPEDDAAEELWRTYYGNIFNPARVKEKAMQAEMPKRYWKNLPEAEIIPVLLQEAPARVAKMQAASAAQVVRASDYGVAQPPPGATWPELQEAARGCQACPLCRRATQTVFGEGPLTAKIVLLGEQPGDVEDQKGRPFVGPAGQLLDRALAEAGLDRAELYLTNTVKHFKWEPRGKRRLHQKPNGQDVAACRPWMEAELQLLHPDVLICLGSTAAGAIFDPGVKVLQDRGEVRPSAFAPRTLITFHPSALLRAPDEATRAQQYRQFVDDLALGHGKQKGSRLPCPDEYRLP